MAEGEVLLRGVLEADPFEAEARHRLGNLYLSQGRGEEGREILDAFERLRVVSHEVNRFRRILNTHPRDADAHYNLGVLYAGQGLYREAAASYRRALAGQPRGHERQEKPDQSAPQTPRAVRKQENRKRSGKGATLIMKWCCRRTVLTRSSRTIALLCVVSGVAFTCWLRG